jgi:hypothetical protein
MSTPSLSKEAAAVAKRAREHNEAMIDLTTMYGTEWLEAYERVLDKMLRLQERAAASTQLEWVNALAATSADFIREMSTAYFQRAREQLK